MPTSEPSTSQAPETRDLHNEDAETSVAATPTHLSAQTQEETSKPDNNKTGEMGQEEVKEPMESVAASDPPLNPSTIAPQPASLLDQEPLAGQMESLSVSGNTIP